MIRKIKKEVGCSFKENIQYMDQTLPVEKSFDIIRREMEIGGKESVFYYIDGFIKDEAMLKIMDSFLSITAEVICLFVTIFYPLFSLEEAISSNIASCLIISDLLHGCHFSLIHLGLRE